MLGWGLGVLGWGDGVEDGGLLKSSGIYGKASVYAGCLLLIFTKKDTSLCGSGLLVSNAVEQSWSERHVAWITQ